MLERDGWVTFRSLLGKGFNAMVDHGKQRKPFRVVKLRTGGEILFRSNNIGESGTMVSKDGEKRVDTPQKRNEKYGKGKRKGR